MIRTKHACIEIAQPLSAWYTKTKFLRQAISAALVIVIAGAMGCSESVEPTNSQSGASESQSTSRQAKLTLPTSVADDYRPATYTELLFNDEFDGVNRDGGIKFDASKWCTRFTWGGGPTPLRQDPECLMYNAGTLDYVNDENQRYREVNENGDELHVIQNGVISLLATELTDPVDYPNQPWIPQFRFEAAMLRTKQLFKPTPTKSLYVTTRIQLPTGLGVWPAFWFVPTLTSATDSGQWPPEIDILEGPINGDPGENDYTLWQTSKVGTPGADGPASQTESAQVEYNYVDPLVFNDLNYTERGFNSTYGFWTSPTSLRNRWVEVGAEWTYNEVCYFVDGVKTACENYRWVDNLGNPGFEANLIINFAVGGAWAGRNGVASDAFPAELMLDYIRVYERNLSAEESYATAIPAAANIDGLQPAPIPFATGSAYIANNVSRLTRGSLQSAAPGESTAVIDAGSCKDNPSEVRFSSLENATNITAVFCGVGASADSSAQAYFVRMERDSIDAPWDVLLIRNDGPGDSLPLVLEKLSGLVPANSPEVTMLLQADAGKVFASLTALGQTPTLLSSPDASFRGGYTGTLVDTQTGNQPRWTWRYGISDIETGSGTDTDRDGVLDGADVDDDNDGVLDTDDLAPLDPSIGAGDNGPDTDNDGTPDGTDPDDDNDGVLDGDDAFPLDDTESVDTDTDGTGNNEDTDDDNDGVLDTDDLAPLDPSVGAGGGNNNGSADAVEGLDASIPAAASAVGLEPAPAPFSTGATYQGRNVARLTGGGLRGSANGWVYAAIDSGVCTGKVNEATFTNLTNTEIMAVNFCSVEPQSGWNTRSYILRLQRNNTSSPWDARLLVANGGGSGNASTLDLRVGVAPADATSVTVRMTTNATTVSTDVTSAGGAATNLFAVDSRYRGNHTGVHTFVQSNNSATWTWLYGIGDSETTDLDTDKDGTPDTTDPDDDNDGVLDDDDAFPLDDTESVDTDNDGTGNNTDADDDNDGVLDVNDIDPLNPNVGTGGSGNNGNSAEAVEGLDTGIAAVDSVVGLEPSPTTFATGSTYEGRNVARKAGGGLFGSANGWVNAVVSGGVCTGKVNQATLTNLRSTEVMAVNFCSIEPQSGWNTRSYILRLQRNDTTSPWDARLLVANGGGSDNASTLDLQLGVAPADATSVTVRMTADATAVSTDITPAGGTTTKLFAVDSSHRGTYTGAHTFVRNNDSIAWTWQYGIGAGGTIEAGPDTDNDGTPDGTDPDDDNDGVLDGDDAFPLDDTESVDTDTDGTGNNEDTDDDNDGVLDTDDLAPLDPSVGAGGGNNNGSADAVEGLDASIPAAASAVGLEPAPAPFSTGATYQGRNVARLTGGGLRGSANGWVYAAIDSGVCTGKVNEATFTNLTNTEIMAVNFCSVEPQSGWNTRSYILRLQRNNTSSPWDARLLVANGGGSGNASTLDLRVGVAPADATSVTVRMTTNATTVSTDVTSAGGAATNLFAVDSRYRGNHTGVHTFVQSNNSATWTWLYGAN